MSLFSFFSKKKKSKIPMSYDRLYAFFSKHDLIDEYQEEGFYEAMFAAFIKEMDERYKPEVIRFREEFAALNKQFQAVLNPLIQSQFDPALGTTCSNTYSALIQATHEFPVTPRLFIAYWDKVLKEIKKELESDSKGVDMHAFSGFYAQFDAITKEEFKKGGLPPGR